MCPPADTLDNINQIIESPEVMSEESQSIAISATPATVPSQYLKFISVELSSHIVKATIEIDSTLTTLLGCHIVNLFRHGNFEGFHGATIPTEYIEDTYKGEIYSRLKDYFFYHHAIDFLMNEIFARKINITNYPRLASIELLSDKRINYHFDISVADPLELKEWKHFAFKPPKRKKYKDLDKQVVSFIESRPTGLQKPNCSIIQEGDWVWFQATMINKDQAPVSEHLTSLFWLHISQQDIAEPFVAQLMGKEIGSCFITNYLSLNDDDQKADECNIPFLITIKAIVKGSLFSLETFKTTFKLKNKTEIHNKLMEVFSYRNDISQRKAIIEEVFHLLLSKHRFEVPKHHVLRREEEIISTLAQRPDYHVYKAQKDFESFVAMLAEKQLKEEIIIDQIAYHENIKVELKDIGQYLHLFTNRRLKEFIYFKPILQKIDEASGPINSAILSQAVMREKTLNFIIHSLTK
jgi:FKBP-type peptidyl-prolyl cis-trans isomerase (trigger factor)